jgi:hypothetical protein
LRQVSRQRDSDRRACSDQASSQSRQKAVRFNAAGELLLPEGHRNWLYLGSPLTPNALDGGNAPFPEYYNVYIDYWAFEHFRRTGQYVEGTRLVVGLSVNALRVGDGSASF